MVKLNNSYKPAIISQINRNNSNWTYLVPRVLRAYHYNSSLYDNQMLKDCILKVVYNQLEFTESAESDSRNFPELFEFIWNRLKVELEYWFRNFNDVTSNYVRMLNNYNLNFKGHVKFTLNRKGAG